MLLSAIAVFASCGASQLETWGGSRFEAKYDKTVFSPTINYENDLTLKLAEEGIEVITISAMPTFRMDKSITRDDYYESAKNEFEAEFDNILNSKPSKIDNKGITTYTESVTATKPGSEDNYSATLKLIIMDDALMMLKMSVKSEVYTKHAKQINEVIDSAILKGVQQ